MLGVFILHFHSPMNAFMTSIMTHASDAVVRLASTTLSMIPNAASTSRWESLATLQEYGLSWVNFSLTPGNYIASALWALLILAILFSLARSQFTLGKKFWHKMNRRAFVPVVNLFHLTNIAEKPRRWAILLFINPINAVVLILLIYSVIRRCGFDLWAMIAMMFASPLAAPFIARVYNSPFEWDDEEEVNVDIEDTYIHDETIDHTSINDGV